MHLGLDKRFQPTIPLIVVGALRSGGSGKTSVSLELVRQLIARGHRPAIMAYRLAQGVQRENAKKKISNGLIEVRAEDDWRHTSDEAVMMSQISGVRVFVTRNRAKAWKLLHHDRYHASNSFDVLISDDGFQDPRLAKAFQILLSAPQEKPHLFDLLPAGPFRETWRARKRADLWLQGPMPLVPSTSVSPKNSDQGNPQGTGTCTGKGACFYRRLIFPVEFKHHTQWMVFSALGNNGPFLDDLNREGIKPVSVITGRNHAPPPLRILELQAAKYPDAGILCTDKDFLKFSSESIFPLCPISQSIRLDAKTLAAVDAYLVGFRSRNLVHYLG